MTISTKISIRDSATPSSPDPASERSGAVAAPERDITATIAHELKQPLASILLTAQAGVRMIDMGNDARDVRALLCEIAEACKRADGILRRIRDGR